MSSSVDEELAFSEVTEALGIEQDDLERFRDFVADEDDTIGIDLSHARLPGARVGLPVEQTPGSLARCRGPAGGSFISSRQEAPAAGNTITGVLVGDSVVLRAFSSGRKCARCERATSSPCGTRVLSASKA